MLFATISQIHVHVYLWYLHVNVDVRQNGKKRNEAIRRQLYNF